MAGDSLPVGLSSGDTQREDGVTRDEDESHGGGGGGGG